VDFQEYSTGSKTLTLHLDGYQTMLRTGSPQNEGVAFLLCWVLFQRRVEH
jgi:hypothetical protein